MKERILEFLIKENKSAAHMAEEIGVQPSGISHILSGRNKPSLDFVVKMLEKYKFLSSDWLLFGKGNMYRDVAVQNLFKESDSEAVNDDGRNVLDADNHKDIKENLLEKTSFKNQKEESTVEKIVWFYSDNSFRAFLPGGE